MALATKHEHLPRAGWCSCDPRCGLKLQPNVVACSSYSYVILVFPPCLALQGTTHVEAIICLCTSELPLSSNSEQNDVYARRCLGAQNWAYMSHSVDICQQRNATPLPKSADAKICPACHGHSCLHLAFYLLFSTLPFFLFSTSAVS